MTYQQQNYLQTNRATLMLPGVSKMEYTVQRFALPSILLPEATVATPFSTQKYAGDHLEYGELSVVFIVDEDLNNWLQLHNWMRGLAFPETYQEYVDKPIGYIDAVMHLYTNRQNPSFKIDFIQIYPKILGGLEFDMTSDATQQVKAHATFTLQRYNINAMG